MRRLVLLACLLCAYSLGACLRPSEDNWERDQVVGRADVASVTLDAGGLAAIRSLSADGATLWAAAPRLAIRVQGVTADFALVVRNVLPDAELTRGGASIAREGEGTVARFVLNAGDNDAELILESPDAEEARVHQIGVMSDIQDGVDEVSDIFARMNEDDLRYVVSTGDLSQNGTAQEIERIQDELELLEVPFYSTVGNHETPGPDVWHDYFGPFNTRFIQHGVAVSLVDSSNATIDPNVRSDMLEFADNVIDLPHLFLTHVPLFDTSGIRSGAFRSRNEAAKTVQELASRNVDALFFGHVHSYYAYDLAGIESYISGGGGAIEERLDGIGRHYLRVNMEPESDVPIETVVLVRVD